MSYEELIEEMDQRMQFPGVQNAWTQPIRARIDMLSTGIRTPVGIKIFGPDLDIIQELGIAAENILQSVPGTRSAYAERVSGGYFTDIRIDREAIARYGLTVGEVQMVIQSALGGMNITRTIEGRERYPVNVRYMRELRDDIEKIKRILVPVNMGGGGAMTPRRCRCSDGPDPAGAAGRHQHEYRTGHDPRRRCHAGRVCLYRCRRPRSGRLC
jgi:copper/silver efflux system protein